MVSAFEELGLLPQFVQAVEKLGFEEPTPIQRAAIPALLNGRDVIGQAQTGTGKTAAFMFPLLQRVQPRQGAVQALVLAPTRELANQVANAASQMANYSPLRVLPVYGGQPYQIQIRQLERGVDVVVGTPGRLLDLMEKKVLDLSQVRYLVLDEADEMLEMGFIEDVETILAALPEQRQIALFSATLPEAVRKLAESYLNNPERISINPERRTVAETEQRYCRVREESKLNALIGLLEVEDVKSALIFARTRARTQELADELNQMGYPAEALHGDLTQSTRESVLGRFRRRALTLLVATDVAARGLDIEDVSHVFNFDVPANAEDYVHRIGRTGRAGRKGMAITLLAPRDRRLLGQIEAYTRQKVTEMPVPTRTAIQARRDERFLERLTAQLAEGQSPQEHSLIVKLENSGAPLINIAAAAIQLARASEAAIVFEDIVPPAVERKSARRADFDRRPARENTRPEAAQPAGRPARAPRGEKYTRPAGAPSWDKHPQEPGMVRLRMNMGEQHGLRARDVVGAIASEVGIPGRAIGEIDIHREFTFVDVAEKHVRQVLRESGGRYSLRGRPVMLTLAD